MLVTVSANSSVDLKALILTHSGVAVEEGDIVVAEWAENPNAGSKVYLVSTSDDINSFDSNDGVLISGNTSSVNFIRGVEASADNIYLSNKSKFTCNFLVYVS